ncbi:potassium channel family protein [Chondrinema litorale]|uniref:potassium channel family protein n=1 Tax=Chondrinema litorale TaxID=2994555 RepID=UPI0025434E5A|nr:potassium channel family protein [Chondrinema litorale]UZR98561.1 potassium channel family protein [Chondrinema litorale]
MLILGIGLTITTIIDILITTLSPNGSGFITSYVTRYTWEVYLRVSNNKPKKHFLKSSGVVIICLVLTIWVTALWIGNTLIIYTEPQALLDSDGLPVQSFGKKLYYMGYVLSTLGNGEYKPSNNFWQLYTSLISFNGLILITVALSYVVPILEAVVKKRKLSLEIASIGINLTQIIESNWEKDKFSSFLSQCQNLKSEILQLSQLHLAYPILHYFHSTEVKTSLPMCISSLYEVINFINCAIKDESLKKEIRICNLSFALTTYFQTLNTAHIAPSEKPPPLPNFKYLRQKGIPILESDIEIQQNYDQIKERRKLINGCLSTDGWKWEEMENYQEEINFI